MLTRSGHALILVAVGLVTLGLGTGNPVLLGLSAIPAMALIVGFLQTSPQVRTAGLTCPNQARAGDVLEVALELELDGPSGLVLAGSHLPPEFDLVSGSNVHLLTKGRGRVTIQRTFEVRATKRGQFTLGPLAVTAQPANGLRSEPPEAYGDAHKLEVHPRIVPIRRLRAMRGTAATIAPDEDVAAVGLQTTDFKELRQYRWGDPPRSVNWKATARLAATQAPLVNEYEVEGRKAVWFLLDAGRHMVVGTNVENGFEVAIAAVSGLALAYLDRGYKVGLYAYNTDAADPLYPDVGTKQFLKIQRYLAQLEPGEGDEGPLQAVQRCRSWLVASSPMVIFVTRTGVQTEHLEQALRRLRALTPGKKRPMLIIEPEAFHLVPGDEATTGTARLLSHLARPRHERLRRLGAVVIPWNPEAQPLEELLFRGVVP